MCWAIYFDCTNGGVRDWVWWRLLLMVSKNILEVNLPWLVCTKIFWVWKVRWDQYIFHMTLCIYCFVVSLVDKRKMFWLVLPVTLTHTQINLRPWLFCQWKYIGFSHRLKRFNVILLYEVEYIFISKEAYILLFVSK